MNRRASLSIVSRTFDLNETNILRRKNKKFELSQQKIILGVSKVNNNQTLRAPTLRRKDQTVWAAYQPISSQGPESFPKWILTSEQLKYFSTLKYCFNIQAVTSASNCASTSGTSALWFSSRVPLMTKDWTLIQVLYEIILCKAAEWKRILCKIGKNLIEVSSWCKLFVSRTRCSWKAQ